MILTVHFDRTLQNVVLKHVSLCEIFGHNYKVCQWSSRYMRMDRLAPGPGLIRLVNWPLVVMVIFMLG